MEIERIKNLVEKAGSGFLRIKRAMEKYVLPMANIYFSKRLFEVTFQRPDLQVNSYKRRVIDGKDFEYTKKDLQKDLIKLNKNQKRIVAKLKNLNIIKRVGPAKGGYWEVIE